MNKINKTFKAIKKIANQPSLLNLILNQNEFFKKDFLKKYPKMLALPQLSLVDFEVDFSSEVESFILDGSSIITDLALLKTLAKNKLSYFEIGTWRGESVHNVAKVIEDCTTLNLSKDAMIKLGLDIKYAELHGFLSKKNSKILHLEGNTKTFDFQKLNKKYDLIFIDGDHTYEMVKNDTHKVFENLVHEDSVVVWHDYAYHPEKIRYEVYKGILDGVPKEHHQNLYHVQNTMCAVFSKKMNGKRVFESPKTPEILFKVNLKIQK